MAKGNDRLNGKVNILAQAMRDVFQECMDGTREEVKEDVRTEFLASEKRITSDVKTTMSDAAESIESKVRRAVNQDVKATMTEAAENIESSVRKIVQDNR